MKRNLVLILAVMLIAVFAAPALAADIPIYDFNTATNNQLHEYKDWVGGHYEYKNSMWGWEYGDPIYGWVDQMKDLVASGAIQFKGPYYYNKDTFNSFYKQMTDHTLSTSPNHVNFMRTMRAGYYVPPFNDNLADASTRTSSYQGSLQQLSTFGKGTLDVLVEHAEVVGFAGPELVAARNTSGLYTNHAASAKAWITKCVDLMEALGLSFPCAHKGDTYEVVTLEPGCKDSGLKDVYCADCDELVEEGVVIAALGHNPGAAADCENDQVCTVCGDILAEALGHDFDLTESHDATCEQEGYEILTCANCFITDRVGTDIPLGHNLKLVYKNGEWMNECSRCDYWEAADAPALTDATTSAKDIVSLVETQNNVWTVTFDVTLTYEDGTVLTETREVVIGKNSSGQVVFANYTLTYDIKGNGSNIKTFSIE